MPTYPPPPVTFVRGQGTRLWDDDGKEYLDFLSGLAVTSLGHAHPAVADALHRAGPDPAARLQPLRHRSPAPRSPRTLDRLLGGGGQVFFTNSGAEANECAIKLARKWGGRGARRGQRARVVPRPHARHAPRHRPAGQKCEAFQPLPEGFRHVAWNDLDALERPLDPSVAAVLLEPVQGEGGVNPATAEYFAGRPAAVRRAGPPVHGRRGPDRPRPDRAVVRPPALRRGARRRHHGQGARQRRAHRRLLGAGRRGRRLRARRPRHHLRRPAARRRGGPGGARRDGGRGRPGPGRPPPARTLTEALLGDCRSVAEVRGLGLLLAAELADGIDARAVAADGARPRAWSSTPSPPTALRLAPSLLITDDEIDEARRASSPRRVLEEAARMTRHLLEIDDLTADELAEVLDRCAPGRSRSACCDGPGRRPALREAVDPHAQLHRDGGRRSWAATRSTSSPTRSASTAARPPRTSPAPSPATTPSSRRGSSTTPCCERMAAVGRDPGRQPAVRRRATRCRPSPTSSRSGPSSARPRRPHGRVGRRLLATWPARSASPRRMSGMGSASPARTATARRPTTSTASAELGAAEAEHDGDPDDGRRGRRRGGRPTPGTRWARRTRRRSASRDASSAFRVDEALLDRAARRRHLPPLPPGPPRRGGHRRGARRSAQPGLARGRQPPATPPAARSSGWSSRRRQAE